MSSDVTLGDTIYRMFTTRDVDTSVPQTLGGTPVVSAYENDSLTQITAGITLGVDHDSVTGLNLLTLVLTSGNGYESGKDYTFVITTGTVDGVSVVGEVVAEVTIERSAAAVDLANGTDGLGAIKSETASILTDTAEIGAAGAGLTDLGGMSTAMKAEVNAEADTALTDYDPPTRAELTSDINSVLSQLPAVGPVEGTSDSGTTTTMVDAARTESDDDYWKGSWILFTSGNINGQCRLITGFTASSDTITFTPATTQAVSTQTYRIIPAGQLEEVLALTGHTVQTGDSFARIGANGAGLSAIPWNASWDAEVQSEVDDALIAQGLDHLLGAAVVGADVTNNSIFARLVSKSATADWDDFVNTTDSLQAIRDKQTDIETDTAEIGTAGAGLTDLGGMSTTMKAEVNTEVSDVLKTDTISEMAQQAPPTTPTFEEALMYLYMALVHKIDVDSGFKEFYNNAGTVIWKKALSDDGSNYIEAESETGP